MNNKKIKNKKVVIEQNWFTFKSIKSILELILQICVIRTEQYTDVKTVKIVLHMLNIRWKQLNGWPYCNVMS